ncbi:MAG: hypothetical protein ACFB0F_02915 [Neomegalonema sp.]
MKYCMTGISVLALLALPASCSDYFDRSHNFNEYKIKNDIKEILLSSELKAGERGSREDIHIDGCRISWGVENLAHQCERGFFAKLRVKSIDFSKIDFRKRLPILKSYGRYSDLTVFFKNAGWFQPSRLHDIGHIKYSRYIPHLTNRFKDDYASFSLSQYCGIRASLQEFGASAVIKFKTEHAGNILNVVRAFSEKCSKLD